jgi:hypothetical protein
MILIAGSTATLRHRLIGVLSATGLGGAVIVADRAAGDRRARPLLGQ